MPACRGEKNAKLQRFAVCLVSTIYYLSTAYSILTMMLISPLRSLPVYILLRTIMCRLCPTEALSPHKTRRAFVSVTVTAASTILSTQESKALQKKNEALCGTGFFEHIYEYKCTTIGDISDEAKSKSMDEKMEIEADLLMEKLNRFEKKDTQEIDTIEMDKTKHNKEKR